jgi:hypothetical protein
MWVRTEEERRTCASRGGSEKSIRPRSSFFFYKKCGTHTANHFVVSSRSVLLRERSVEAEAPFQKSPLPLMNRHPTIDPLFFSYNI